MTGSGLIWLFWHAKYGYNKVSISSCLHRVESGQSWNEQTYAALASKPDCSFRRLQCTRGEHLILRSETAKPVRALKGLRRIMSKTMGRYLWLTSTMNFLLIWLPFGRPSPSDTGGTIM